MPMTPTWTWSVSHALALPPTAYTILPRITTHGMRAAQIAGIRFHGARVPAGALIGRPGSGLELASAALAITRTLVPALSPASSVTEVG